MSVTVDPEVDAVMIRYQPEGRPETRSQREGDCVYVHFDSDSQVVAIELIDFDAETIGIARRFADRQGLIFPDSLGGVPSKTQRFYVVFETGEEGGWGAFVPDLPGCIAVGSTRDEVRELIRGSIALHLKEMREDGTPLPLPAGEFIDVMTNE